MEAHAADILGRIALHDQPAIRNGQPVIEPRQHEAQRRAARQNRQRSLLVATERPHRLIASKQRRPLGQVEGKILLEAPGVEAGGDVVGVEVVASEIEVDQAGQFLAEEEDVVRKQIGVDDALRQAPQKFGLVTGASATPPRARRIRS